MKKRRQQKRKVAKSKAPKRKAAKQPAMVTEFLDILEGEWVWCLHCQRCYQVGEQRNGRDGLEYCHYQDCNGDAVFDVWAWENIRAGYPNYPKEPERNKVYQI